MQPDILVVQEMTSQAGMNDFLNTVMNSYTPSLFAAAPFNDGPDTDNGIFYRPDKWEYIGANYIGTALRNIAEYTVRPLNSMDTVRIYSVHLKASSGSSNDTLRLAEATILRNRTNSLPVGSKFLIVGDFNIYRSSEPAFQKLIGSEANNNGRVFDPLNLLGTWQDNPAFALHHTQSPRVRSFGGGSTGGLDDRFDMILPSTALQGWFITSSYTAYGNDGNHMNDSINRLPNTAVPDSIANALHYASDHLPVFASIVFEAQSIPPPVAPSLVLPPEDFLVVAPNVLFQWGSSPGATSYQLQVATDSLFSGIVLDDSTLVDTTRQVPLGNGGTYHWRVKSRNVSGTSAFSPGRSFRIAVYDTNAYDVMAGWNLISLPLLVGDSRKSIVFPTAASPAFKFSTTSGYTQADTLRFGVGYWLKFDTNQQVNLAGYLIDRDTIQVSSGWNLIGTVSSSVAVSGLETIPPGIIVSDFYRYSSGYLPADTLHPGKAYWVKASSQGRIVLRPTP